MQVQVQPKVVERLLPTAIVQQTAFWGRVERRLGYDVLAFDVQPSPDRSEAVPASGSRGPATKPSERGPSAMPRQSSAGPRWDFLVIRRPISEQEEMAYVPFGPEYTPEEGSKGALLEQLSEHVRRAIGPRCLFVRWDLPWVSPYALDPSRYDGTGTWLGAPDPWVRELRMNFGSSSRCLRKSVSDQLPVSTLLLDLTATEDELLEQMKPKTRYNIRLAARRGVEVVEGTAADLPAWYRLYLETTSRHGLPRAGLERFRAVLEEGGGGSSLPVRSRLLLARRGPQLLAGLLLVCSGHRATYLYGASTREGRSCMASCAMQWAAIRLARALGCREYDMFGIAPRPDPGHPLFGLYRFKTGFGGRQVHLEGCWDYPCDFERYERWRAWESQHLGGERAAGPL